MFSCQTVLNLIYSRFYIHFLSDFPMKVTSIMVILKKQTHLVHFTAFFTVQPTHLVHWTNWNLDFSITPTHLVHMD